MKRYGLLAALFLLLAVNAHVLANVARNRFGVVESEVRLTERELPLVHPWNWPDKENSGLSLRLRWEIYYPLSTKEKGRRRKIAPWFDQAKLESIGFDCSRPLNSENADRYYNKMLPRKTYVVLEYEGKAWQAWLEDQKQQMADIEMSVLNGKKSRKELNEIMNDYERSLKTQTRLFAVDAGNDPEELRQKYQDRSRFIITPATVRLSYHRKDEREGERERLEGDVSKVLIDEINVPLSMRSLLSPFIHRENQQREENSVPRYAVTVSYGKHFEPWIIDIQGMAGQERGGTDPKAVDHSR